MIPDSKGWGILSRMIRANDDGGRKKKTWSQNSHATHDFKKKKSHATQCHARSPSATTISPVPWIIQGTVPMSLAVSTSLAVFTSLGVLWIIQSTYLSRIIRTGRWQYVLYLPCKLFSGFFRLPHSLNLSQQVPAPLPFHLKIWTHRHLSGVLSAVLPGTYVDYYFWFCFYLNPSPQAFPLVFR